MIQVRRRAGIVNSTARAWGPSLSGAARPPTGQHLGEPDRSVPVVLRVDVRERLHLVRANREAIAVMLARAAADGLEPALAVVTVIDQRDELGKELAQVAGERAGLDAFQQGARANRLGQIPTVIFVVDLSSAAELFSATHPAVAAGLSRRPPEGCVRVVAVAAGGAMLAHSEIDHSLFAMQAPKG